MASEQVCKCGRVKQSSCHDVENVISAHEFSLAEPSTPAAAYLKQCVKEGPDCDCVGVCKFNSTQAAELPRHRMMLDPSGWKHPENENCRFVGCKPERGNQGIVEASTLLGDKGAGPVTAGRPWSKNVKDAGPEKMIAEYKATSGNPPQEGGMTTEYPTTGTATPPTGDVMTIYECGHKVPNMWSTPRETWHSNSKCPACVEASASVGAQPDCSCGVGNDAYPARHAKSCSLMIWATPRCPNCATLQAERDAANQRVLDHCCGKAPICCGDAHQELESTMLMIAELGFEKEEIQREGHKEIIWHNRRAEQAEAERDRLREDMNKFVSKAMELGLDPADNGTGWHNERAEAAESQLAEARKVLKTTLTSIEKFCEALAKSNNQVCVDAVAEITSCAINLKASLSQPTTPPAVPSEEEVARITCKRCGKQIVDSEQLCENFNGPHACEPSSPAIAHIDAIIEKCEFYWNIDGICNAEIHASLENIHRHARAVLALLKGE